jgi:hypothetical protein
MEMLAEAERARTIATGPFIHADLPDPLDYGSGCVTVTEGPVLLKSYVDVRRCPDFRPYLVAHPEVRRSADVPSADVVDLGRLRAFQGSLRDAIPDGVELALRERSDLVPAVLGAGLARRSVARGCRNAVARYPQSSASGGCTRLPS